MTAQPNYRTAITRLRERGTTDRAALNTLLDTVHVGHFGLVDDTGLPVVLPTLVVRDGDRVLAHGSTGSRWMRLLAGGAPTCLTVTALDAVVVARSAFESSMRYRSAVLFGSCTSLSGADKAAALDVVTDALVPGRTSEIRRSTNRELDATLIMALPIDQWSLKMSEEWPDDPPEDVAGDAWAGVIPLHRSYGTPLPAPDLRAGLAVPASVGRLVASQPLA
jgi:nitroimidazol reductase NimA-like FMN-containing flavoprotein (pyridoxamine 5'-phosphate oxidase superfamily)